MIFGPEYGRTACNKGHSSLNRYSLRALPVLIGNFKLELFRKP